MARAGSLAKTVRCRQHVVGFPARTSPLSGLYANAILSCVHARPERGVICAAEKIFALKSDERGELHKCDCLKVLAFEREKTQKRTLPCVCGAQQLRVVSSGSRE